MLMVAKYSDIPRDERKRLAVVAYRQSRVRTLLFAAIFIPMLFSKTIADYVVPQSSSLLAHFGVTLGISLIFTAVIWESVGRGLLKAEIVKLKNA